MTESAARRNDSLLRQKCPQDVAQSGQSRRPSDAVGARDTRSRTVQLPGVGRRTIRVDHHTPSFQVAVGVAGGARLARLRTTASIRFGGVLSGASNTNTTKASVVGLDRARSGWNESQQA